MAVGDIKILKNVFPVDDLRSLARRKSNASEFKSVPNALVQAPTDEGWHVYRKGASTTRLVREKARSVLLEDRVWSLLYKLGFTHLSGDGGLSCYSIRRITTERITRLMLWGWTQRWRSELSVNRRKLRESTLNFKKISASTL